jgi:hypothetical protein
MARMLAERGQSPAGVVLESPFFNIVEEVEYHPFIWVIKKVFSIVGPGFAKTSIF